MGYLALGDAEKVWATVDPIGGTLFKTFVSDPRKKKEKKRQQRAAVAQAQEDDRRQRVLATQVVRDRTSQLVGAVQAEVNRVTNTAASVVLYAAKLDTKSTRDMLLGQIQQLQIGSSDLLAKVADYDLGRVDEDSPIELVKELREQADRENADAGAVLKQARGLGSRADLLFQQALGAVQRQTKEQQALVAAQEIQRQTALLRATAAPFVNVPTYTDSSWQRALSLTAYTGATVVSPVFAPGAVAGLAGTLTDLFGGGKKKEEDRAKDAAQAVATRAEIALRRQEADLAARRAAQLRLFSRDVEAESGLAAQAIDAVRVGISTAPSLPAAILNEAGQAVTRWEPQVLEILSGVRSIDLRVTDRGAQEAFLVQAGAALAAMRAIRIEATALSQRVVRAGALSRTTEDRIQELRAQQQALGVRERDAASLLLNNASLDLAERSFAAEQGIMRAKLQVQQQVDQERAALQLSLSRLRSMERTVPSLMGGAW